MVASRTLGPSSRLLLQEGRQHHTDEVREQLVALRVGQRRHAVDDGCGGAEDEALELVLVHRAGLRLEPGGLEQLAHARGGEARGRRGSGHRAASLRQMT